MSSTTSEKSTIKKKHKSTSHKKHRKEEFDSSDDKNKIENDSHSSTDSSEDESSNSSGNEQKREKGINQRDKERDRETRRKRILERRALEEESNPISNIKVTPQGLPIIPGMIGSDEDDGYELALVKLVANPAKNSHTLIGIRGQGEFTAIDKYKIRESAFSQPVYIPLKKDNSTKQPAPTLHNPSIGCIVGRWMLKQVRKRRKSVAENKKYNSKVEFNGSSSSRGKDEDDDGFNDSINHENQNKNYSSRIYSRIVDKELLEKFNAFYNLQLTKEFDIEKLDTHITQVLIHASLRPFQVQLEQAVAQSKMSNNQKKLKTTTGKSTRPQNSDEEEEEEGFF